jgi:hypothetical protein
MEGEFPQDIFQFLLALLFLSMLHAYNKISEQFVYNNLICCSKKK